MYLRKFEADGQVTRRIDMGEGNSSNFELSFDIHESDSSTMGRIFNEIRKSDFGFEDPLPAVAVEFAQALGIKIESTLIAVTRAPIVLLIALDLNGCLVVYSQNIGSIVYAIKI